MASRTASRTVGHDETGSPGSRGFQRSPGGIWVRSPESVAAYLKERVIAEEPFYVPRGWERVVARACFKAKLPMMWKGPTSTGKTRLAANLAWELKVPEVTVQCTVATQPYHLLGSERPLNGDGMYFKDGPLTLSVRSKDGALIYINEILRADREVDAALYSLADNRRQMFVDQTLEVLNANERVMLVVDYNPPVFDTNRMEGPTKQRFVGYVFEWHEAATEKAIVAREVLGPGSTVLKGNIDAALAKERDREAEAVENAKTVRKWTDTEWGAFFDQLESFILQVRRMHSGNRMIGEPGPRLMVNAAKLVKEGVPAWVAISCAVAAVLTDNPSQIAAINDEITKTGRFTQPASGV